jgi:hypothetical protein
MFTNGFPFASTGIKTVGLGRLLGTKLGLLFSVGVGVGVGFNSATATDPET